MADPWRLLPEARVGLLAHPASVTANLTHAVVALKAVLGERLCLLFGPEHGLRGTAQYMESVADSHAEQEEMGIPVRALYGHSEATLRPRAADLARIDVLVIDLQDVGSRYYTFGATMALCMQAAGEAGVRVLVLDRPNPIGGVAMEGGGILPPLRNFCGLYPVPQRHGLTLGELARLYNTSFDIGCRLDVVPMTGWRRADYFDQTGLPWVLPSPAMPTLDTALVYPGGCLLEATNLSEGRGTCRPFELVGAPWLPADAFAVALADAGLPGLRVRPCAFTPTFDKYKGELCYGVQLHVTDRRAFRPFRTGLALLHAARSLAEPDFCWRTTPYEFRADVPAIDLLTGTPEVRGRLEAGAGLGDLLAACNFGLETFTAGRPASLLYRP